ncbi:hypothetical protein [Streptomyces silvisoli]|uniref:PASTA domain-containing protein n=1 Tax=Streptomyces silvisoli TaxID=3034235 RepID=A0ABT5ZII0_9ACTN|nr:hypothetical protein [Streptomyces silvisoli]MDF3289639.1 hypothetical protein [Streptomyces silvisoli]
MRRTTATAVGAVALLGALAAPAQAGAGAMPDVTGKGLVAAERAMPHGVRITLVDARDAGRHVLWPANWKVCSQSPAPGRPLGGQRAELRVVKTKERCP